MGIISVHFFAVVLHDYKVTLPETSWLHLSSTDDILKTLDSHNDNEVVLVMLDLSAAFDTLDHTLLVERLRSYFGFSGTALQCFSSYLHDRFQRVIIGDTISSSRYLEFGVPQGSTLGPLLFTLYIVPRQDVIQAYNLNCMFYADDSQVYIGVNPNHPSDALTTLRHCVEHIFSWSTRNMLKSILERPRCCILHHVL